MEHNLSAPPRRAKHIGSAVRGLSLALALGLAGCASMPPPDAAMNQAQEQLQAARDAGAADYDPVDLGFAQHKFQLAQAAMASRQFAEAADLAAEARADAELARGKARLGHARAQIQAKVEENTQLREQFEQAAQAPSPAAPASSAAPVLQDMPAPSASVLSAPLPQPENQPAPASSAAPQGFQPMPQPADTTDGGQP